MLRPETPCDFGPCPYSAEYNCTCEYYCGADEPQEDYDEEDWEEQILQAETYTEEHF